MDKKKIRLWFVIGHGIVLTLLLLFPLYKYLLSLLPSFMTTCTMYQLLHLYCAVCGGTRAVDALMHLDILSALRYNAFITVAAISAIILDAVAWVRFFLKKHTLLPIPSKVWTASLWILAAFFLLRNILMVAVGFDPMGDLVGFWNKLLR